MGWVILVILLALAFGIVGLVVKILKWMLILAVILFVVGLVAGFRKR